MIKKSLKNLIIPIFLLLPAISFAQKIAITGQNISTDKINSSIAQIGEIKHSILSLEQFQSLNGDCWVKMQGQNIAGSDLAQMGITNLPDASGRFLRAEGGSAAALGLPQEDDFKSHTHAQSPHQHTGRGRTNDSSYPVSSALGLATDTVLGINASTTLGSLTRVRPTTGAFDAATAVNQNTGGTETRPKNLTVNFFIKINKQCNFN